MYLPVWLDVIPSASVFYHIYLQIDLFHDIDEENKNEKDVLPDPSKKNAKFDNKSRKLKKMKKS